MTAIEAMIYCLGEISDVPSDVDLASRTAYDADGESHWIAWRVSHGKTATPRLCSGTFHPFCAANEPYRISKE